MQRRNETSTGLAPSPPEGASTDGKEEKRAVPRRAKYLAYTMMTASCLMMLYRFPDQWWITAGAAAICLASAVWMSRLPDA